MATYINGNAFRVDFVLWRKDISSYFWHSYFLHPLEKALQLDTARFIHSSAFAFTIVISSYVVSLFLGIANIYFLTAYYVLLLAILTYRQYAKTLQESEPLVGKHYSFFFSSSKIRVVDNLDKSQTEISLADVLRLDENRSMIIIYTNGDDFILPKRVLSREQVDSIRMILG
jgi:hypothetical protein